MSTPPPNSTLDSPQPGQPGQRGPGYYPPASAPKPKKPIHKRVWFWVLVVIAVLFIGGIGSQMGKENAGAGKTEAPSPAASEAATAPKTEEPAAAPKTEEPAAAPIAVEAAALVQAYTDNELGADKEYKGKPLAVTGVVEQVTEVLGQRNVSVGTGAEFSFHSVSCFISKDQVDKAASLKKGDPITVTGTGDGFDQLSVHIKDCKLP